MLTSETEGLHRTVIEAMASDLPCVASDVGDVGDVVEDEVTGYLVKDCKDIDSFVDRINILLDDQQIYHLIFAQRYRVSIPLTQR